MEKNILVTGGTGYLGSWVVKDLLKKGYTVRMALRDKNRVEKTAHLQKIADQSTGTLELWEADLLKEGSFDAAAAGCEIIVHMASPFTLRYKDAKRDLIEPAVRGTKNVLNAATKSGTVNKVVLTSSVVAVYGDNIDMEELGLSEFSEEHFNTTSTEQHQPYSYSKVMAEQEAWKMYEAQDQWKLVVLNPGFVMGPSMTTLTDSESLTYMKDFLKGKYFMGVADLMVGYVDVRDVATAHVLAIENEKAEGRYILVESTISMLEFAELIRKKYGKKYKLPFMTSPKPMLYVVGRLFGVTGKYVKRNVGYPLRINNTSSRDNLGLNYRPLDQTVVDMVEQMSASGMVK